MPDYERLTEKLRARNVDVETVKTALKAQHIETPSWGYGDSGTRFKVFRAPGAARNVYEKIDDAGFIHELTGIAPSIALHIPWDMTDDWSALGRYAAGRGIRIGAINPNLFQADAYKLGSLCHPDPKMRARAVEHMLECAGIMRATGSSDMSLWLADGTNYPGQDDLRARKRRLEETLATVVAALPAGSRLLIEYKFFEPAFYHTDLADWGMAASIARKLGPQAQVLVDLGHHPSGTNVEHIVAFLLDEGLLGGFHFNNRKYADDDLIVGSINPFELFLIYSELVGAAQDSHPDIAEGARRVSYMIDQSHCIEPKLEAMLLSVLNCQTAYAKALIVDRQSLASRRESQDVLGAHRLMVEAFETDVQPLLAQVRREMGKPEDPMAAYQKSAYPAHVMTQRGATAQTNSGYPEAC